MNESLAVPCYLPYLTFGNLFIFMYVYLYTSIIYRDHKVPCYISYASDSY